MDAVSKIKSFLWESSRKYSTHSSANLTQSWPFINAVGVNSTVQPFFLCAVHSAAEMRCPVPVHSKSVVGSQGRVPHTGYATHNKYSIIHDILILLTNILQLDD